MPLYEYACSTCDARFERLIRAPREQRELTCPQCGAQQVIQQLSVFAARGAAAKPADRPPGPCPQCHDPKGSCPFS